jgi:pimeloyl-ACP methyl ester carboxylesterase
MREVEILSVPVLWLAGLASVVLLHGIAVGVFAVAMATPNPFKRIVRRRDPSNFGLQPDPVRLAGGEPGWWFRHPTSRRLVIVLHGRSRSRAWMLPAIAALVPHVHVLAFDFPGHGEMRWRPTTLGLREARSVHAAIDWAEEQGFDDVVLYGTSMGGAAAIFALAERARGSVRGLVTDGTFDRLERVVDGVARRLRAPRYLQAVSMGLLRHAARFDVRRVNPVEAVGRVPVPALFLHGRQDPLVPCDAADHLAAAAACGRALLYPGRHDEPDNSAMLGPLVAFVVEGMPSAGDEILLSADNGTAPALLKGAEALR